MDIKKEGMLVVLSAPSGGGKTTIYKELLRRNSNLNYSVSVTSRKPRINENDNDTYEFVSEQVFKEMIDRGEFAEWARVYNNYYGTRNSTVAEALKNNKICIFDLDIQGAIKLKKKFPQTILVFILPPSFEELRQRLKRRGTDTKETLQVRLRNTATEIACWENYDYLVINDKFGEAVERVEEIIKVEKLKVENIKDINWDIPEKYSGGQLL